MENIKVDIVNNADEVIGEYIVNRLKVGSNARRLSLNKDILELDISEQEKGQLLSCAALAVTVCNVDGELLYPESTAPNDIYNNLDIELFDILCKAYIEVNPIEPTLTAKKKKS